MPANKSRNLAAIILSRARYNASVMRKKRLQLKAAALIFEEAPTKRLLNIITIISMRKRNIFTDINSLVLAKSAYLKWQLSWQGKLRSKSGAEHRRAARCCAAQYTPSGRKLSSGMLARRQISPKSSRQYFNRNASGENRPIDNLRCEILSGARQASWNGYWCLHRLKSCKEQHRWYRLHVIWNQVIMIIDTSIVVKSWNWRGGVRWRDGVWRNSRSINRLNIWSNID